MKQITAMLLLLSMAFLLRQPVQAQSGAPVLAYYYVWWYPGAMGQGKTPDWPDPLYNSAEVIPRQVSQMAGAGVDGLVVGWFGPNEPVTEGNFKFTLEQAQANGIKALLSVDLGTAAWFDSPQSVIDGMRYAISTHTAHPAYFRYGGRPVFVFWYQGRYSLADWAYIRSQVDPNHDTIWIAEGAVPDAIGTFDGLHMYTISWADNVGGTLASWGDTTRARGGLWMATAMPGWDNTYTQQSERYIRDRGNGAFYRESFAGAAASGPNMILITSYNEWVEGSYFEPSAAYGDFYLNLTRELITQYKSSGAVDPGAGSAPPVAAQPQAAPTQVSTTDAGSAQPAATGTVDTATTVPSNIPTPTATLEATAEINATATPQDVAEVVVPDTVPDGGGASEAVEEARSGVRLTRLIPGGVVLVVGIGLLLIAGVGAVGAFRRSAPDDGDKEP